MPSDGVMVSKSLLIKSVTARPDSSTPVWEIPARNAVCVLFKTIISDSTMSDSNVITTRTSTRVKAFVPEGRAMRVPDLRKGKEVHWGLV